jgi:hypothetical protein
MVHDLFLYEFLLGILLWLGIHIYLMPYDNAS